MQHTAIKPSQQTYVQRAAWRNALKRMEAGDELDPVEKLYEYGYVPDDFEPLTSDELNALRHDFLAHYKEGLKHAKNESDRETLQRHQSFCADIAVEYCKVNHLYAAVNKESKEIKKDLRAQYNIDLDDVGVPLMCLANSNVTRRAMSYLRNEGVGGEPLNPEDAYMVFSKLVGNYRRTCGDWASLHGVRIQGIVLPTVGKRSDIESALRSIAKYPDMLKREIHRFEGNGR